ncbi:MAG: hypothetical protein A2V66_13775 [Ignavibacteria bacterium RBG_13_36_8]|nr:MAG: hypothetical protein A2V66_13775 [Ignavibacteria bacterium RBG_13_36_8]
MATWSKNNIACADTWIFLKALGQLNQVFSKSGAIKVEDLAFWNESASPELINIAVKTICQQLDNMFRMIDKALFEKGVTVDNAINSMVGAFLKKGNTVADVAEVVDKKYFFQGERIDE